MVSENPDTEDDLSEIRALNSGKTSASGETVGYRSNPQLPFNQKGMLFHSLLTLMCCWGRFRPLRGAVEC